MRKLKVLFALALHGFVLVVAQKTYLSFGFERKPRSDRMEGFERLVKGYINFPRDIGPVGGIVNVAKYTQNGWKNDYTPIEMKKICDPPYDRLLGPFFAHFSGEMSKLECSIKKGNYTVKDWTMEENIRLAVGDKFVYEKYKFTISLLIPGRKTPICGFAVTIKVEDLDSLEHTLKMKRNNKQ